MPVFLEVCDLPKDYAVLVMNDVAEKYRFTEGNQSTLPKQDRVRSAIETLGE